LVQNHCVRKKIEWDGTKMYGLVIMGTNIDTENNNLVHARLNGTEKNNLLK
jgi:hypothetical protein